VEHSYPAYRAGLLAMFESNPLAAEIAHPVVPLTLVVAQQDQTVLPRTWSGCPSTPPCRSIAYPAATCCR